MATDHRKKDVKRDARPGRMGQLPRLSGPEDLHSTSGDRTLEQAQENEKKEKKKGG